METTPRICELSILLPSQFYRRLKRKVSNRGELQLITAILDDACATYCKHRNAPDSESRRLFQDAKRWVESTDRTWALSFERICEVLALDAAHVRGRLRVAAQETAAEATAVLTEPLHPQCV